MSIDTNGRAHRPAGSPASTGGQYAEQPTPAAAGQLSDAAGDPHTKRLVERSTTLAEMARHAERASEAATAAVFADFMQRTGREKVDIFVPSGRSPLDRRLEPGGADIDDSELQDALDELYFEQVAEIIENDEDRLTLNEIEPSVFSMPLSVFEAAAAAEPPKREYGARVRARREAMREYADESRRELAEELRAVWPDASYLEVSTREEPEWGDSRYRLDRIARADGSTIIDVDPDTDDYDDMWELIEHRTGVPAEQLSDYLDDIGEFHAIDGMHPRDRIELDERIEST